MPEELIEIEDDNPEEESQTIKPQNSGTPKAKQQPKEEDVPWGTDAPDDIDIGAILRGEKPAPGKKPQQAKPKAEPAAEGEPNPETEPAAAPTQEPEAAPEPAKEPEKPQVDIDAEVEKRLQERLSAREAELIKKHEADKQRAIDAVAAKYLKREDSAIRKLRDLQAATGMDPDRLLETHRARQIESLQTSRGLTEEDARAFVLAQEEAALLKSREAERQREHEEQTKTAKYREEKLDFLGDPNQKPILKKALQKFGAEIDQFSDFGRGVDFMVALKYVAGDHLAEITEELENDAKANEAKLRADAEARERAAEQRAIRNLQQRAKAAPETATTGVPQKTTISAGTARMAKEMGISLSALAKTAAKKNR